MKQFTDNEAKAIWRLRNGMRLRIEKRPRALAVEAKCPFALSSWQWFAFRSSNQQFEHHRASLAFAGDNPEGEAARERPLSSLVRSTNNRPSRTAGIRLVAHYIGPRFEDGCLKRGIRRRSFRYIEIEVKLA